MHSATGSKPAKLAPPPAHPPSHPPFPLPPTCVFQDECGAVLPAHHVLPGLEQQHPGAACFVHNFQVDRQLDGTAAAAAGGACGKTPLRAAQPQQLRQALLHLQGGKAGRQAGREEPIQGGVNFSRTGTLLTWQVPPARGSWYWSGISPHTLPHTHGAGSEAGPAAPQPPTWMRGSTMRPVRATSVDTSLYVSTLQTRIWLAAAAELLPSTAAAAAVGSGGGAGVPARGP